MGCNSLFLSIVKFSCVGHIRRRGGLPIFFWRDGNSKIPRMNCWRYKLKTTRHNSNGGGGGYQRRRRSWGTQRRWKGWDKWVEAGWSLVRYCACFCYKNLPILLAPLSFSTLHGWVKHKLRKQAKRDAKRDTKDGIIRHDNRKDLGIPNSLLFQVGKYQCR